MKNYCKHCGAKLNAERQHVCPKLGWWKKIKKFFLGMVNCEDGTENNLDYYERGQSIVPDSIASNESEITVKQYDLATLRTRHKFTYAEGRMQITNKRLLFRATGRSPAGKTVYQSEFAMDKIDGVEIRRDYRFLLLDFFINIWLSSLLSPIGLLIGISMTNNENAFLIVLSFLLALATAVPFFAIKKRYLLKLLILSVGYGIVGAAIIQATLLGNKVLGAFAIMAFVFLAILYIISMFLSFFKPNLVVEVKTSGGTPGVQIKHRYASFFIWKKMEENSGFSEILPGKDADLAIKEIGAIINDIKTLGDYGIDKWKV